ncbi:hypothetical protein [Flaviaesturariibacter amylovorans]|uniref:DUF922 domain-containing protein n=1 Tax=Flaviaesturariibacter amylovorans TaxID=1084520 RepID=A0ABP8H440_9BACT
MRKLLFALAFGAALSGHAQNSSDDRLFWRADQRLSFSDFNGTPKASDTAVTTSATGARSHRRGSINKSIDISLATQPDKTMFDIRAGMKRNSSWMRDRTDSVTLAHEQGHFDICELYARMLRRDIKKARNMQQARKMFDDAMKAEEAEHDRFDKENTYEAGGITAAWAQDLSTRIAALDAFANPVVATRIVQ